MRFVVCLDGCGRQGMQHESAGTLRGISLIAVLAKFRSNVVERHRLQGEMAGIGLLDSASN